MSLRDPDTQAWLELGKARAKAICDAEVAAGRLTPDHHQRPLMERTIAVLAEAQARDDERAVKAERARRAA